MPKLSIIIPCYYNEENIPVTSKRLLENEANFPADVSFEYVMIDDGSKDGTYEAIKAFQAANPGKVVLVKLASNFGSYNAILAGMEQASGDCNTVISCDLQDPPELIAKMYAHWSSGIKLVIANRQDREDDFPSSLFSKFFHSLTRRLALKSLPKGGFDFVLFDRALKDEVVRMKEKNTNTLFLLLWLGYDFVTIPYKRAKREVGKSRWTFSKKLKLFIDSFVAFSFFPIRLISVVGLLLGCVSLLYGIYILISKLMGGIEVQGWTSMMVVFLFVSSFQTIALGIIGEYVWRTLDASRKRPVFIVEEVKRA
ncbi:MAG TPA: glycosyltransferase family 2 protein [Flavisolibacter sp.]|nr:glycosyltransferase family 2 protein [Flavisolibacter sp.]